jgi:predicted PurR-regulated permease PerM
MLNKIELTICSLDIAFYISYNGYENWRCNGMHIDKKTIRNIFIGVACIIVLYWLLNEWDRVQRVWDFVDGILAPFVVGAIFAFILNVPMRAVEGWLKAVKNDRARRALALLLTILMICLVIAGVIMLLIPQLEKTIMSLVEQLPIFFTKVEELVYDFLEERPEVLAWVNENIDLEQLNWATLIETALSTMGNSLASILNSTISVVGTFSGAVVNAVISLVFAFYCLGNKENLARQGRKIGYAIFPEKVFDEVVRVLRMTNSTFSNFITGQCIEAVILALLFVIAMAIFRMPYIPLICVIICVTALVPLVGAFAGCILGAFFILVNDPMQAVTFVIMFLIIQQFEGNVIYPRVVGSSIGLPGMWVLLSVAVGGGLMGVAGMFMMVPLASVLYSLIRKYTAMRLDLLDVDPEKLRPHPPKLQSHFKMKREKRKEKRTERRNARKDKKKEKNSAT